MASPLASSVRAGVAYAATVFAVGFLLGTLRVLVLAPRVGATAAVLIETPVILTASWYVWLYWMKRLAVGTEMRTGILVGAVAFITLMAFEVVLSIGLFERSMSEYLAGLRSPAGAIGFAAQVAFAAFPLLNSIAGPGKRTSDQLSQK